MIVFKAFLKILNKNKWLVILYTVILISTSAVNMTSEDNVTDFVASKPVVVVINSDNSKIADSFIKYIKNNCDVSQIEGKEAIEDALFYRQVDYVIYIPENFGNDMLNGTQTELKVKSTGEYMASYAEMIINRYIKTAHEYSLINDKESVLIGNVEKTLKKQCKINIESKSDTDSISKMKLYFNFANYSILAGCVLVICLIISSFRDEKIVRRISVSSMSYRKHNRILLISSCLFAAFLWAFYVIVSFFIIGREVFSMHGLMYMINSFVFTFCAVTIAFLIANITNSKNAISGIVNVVALGSSFVCGCFVPMQWLPDLVKQVAHVLPSYWYVDANESLSDMSVINISNLNPVFIDMAVVIAFAIVCIVITNLISLKKVKNNR